MKKLLIVLVAIGLLVAIYFVYVAYGQTNANNSGNAQATVSSYDECVAAGFTVKESYPPICVAGDKSFTQDIGNELEKTDLITIDAPRPNAVITSPLTIMGQARGTWFFEGSFPVKLYDENGTLLATGVATSKESWMTEDFITFNAELNFAKPDTKKGKLVLEKDNPSGKFSLDDSLIVPIVFE